MLLLGLVRMGPDGGRLGLGWKSHGGWRAGAGGKGAMGWGGLTQLPHLSMKLTFHPHRVQAAQSQLRQAIADISAHDDLAWWRREHGPGMPTTWPQFEVRPSTPLLLPASSCPAPHSIPSIGPGLTPSPPAPQPTQAWNPEPGRQSNGMKLGQEEKVPLQSNSPVLGR